MKLERIDGHLYISISGEEWLVDTGAPLSFGRVSTIELCGRRFEVARDYLGLDAAQLSDMADHDTAGIIGVDILNQFGLLFDLPGEQLTFGAKQSGLTGVSLDTRELMGIPLIEGAITSGEMLFFFDTGASISYLQSDLLAQHEPSGHAADFYPGFGRFETYTYIVEVSVGGLPRQLRFGVLPELLEGMLLAGGVGGIIGNQLLDAGPVGYFAEQSKLVLT